MTDTSQRQWGARPGDFERIREHLKAQLGLPWDRVRLDDGRVVVAGADAVGEGDDDGDH